MNHEENFPGTLQSMKSSTSDSTLDTLREPMDSLRIKIHERLNDDSKNLAAAYGSYIDFMGEFEIIVKRIEADSESLTSARNKLVEYMRLNSDQPLPPEVTRQFYEWHTKLKLDPKDIFVHTRIFLDTICRIIRAAYGRRGSSLNDKMTQLLKNDHTLQLDYTFFTGLKDNMDWYDDFVKDRDRVVHSFGMLRFIHEDDEARFEVLRNVDDTWGPNTVKMSKFVNDVIRNLSRLVSYVDTNLKWAEK